LVEWTSSGAVKYSNFFMQGTLLIPPPPHRPGQD